MRISGPGAAAQPLLDKRRLDALGVLLPIRLQALSFNPGRHPLGRPGEGMRFLRSRPYEPGEDNPRDIDKFSPEGEYWVNEWEAEARASICVYADVSGSMSADQPAAVRNLALLQLTYSLWRASDRVRTVFYGGEQIEEFAERNLRSQLDKLIYYLSSCPSQAPQDLLEFLPRLSERSRKAKDDLAFLVSDFRKLASTPNYTGSWSARLRSLRCDVIPIIISFELSTEQCGHAKLWDVDSRRQRLVLMTPRRARQINTREAQRVGDLERLFRAIGLDSLTLRQERDVYPSLSTLARLRRRRRI